MENLGRLICIIRWAELTLYFSTFFQIFKELENIKNNY